MRTPLQKFAKQRNVSVRFLYKEVKAGRLVLTKVGSRTFIDDEDEAKWDALALKVTGPAGNAALMVAVQKLQELQKAVAEGAIDRSVVARRLGEVVDKTGLLVA